MRKWLKITCISILSFVLLLALVFTIASISPYPTAWFVRWAFSTTSYTDHVALESTKENITVIENIDYPSSYKNNTLDILYPKESEQPLPVIYWVHGGAFVAGDKRDVHNYMVMLANEGFVVVNINYELAPKAKYPAPLIQIGEAYQYIEDNLNLYPFIDANSLYFGGDSAGAHIAAQFITIQTNPEYVTLLNTIKETKDIEKVVYKEIKGAILFAGPYDFNSLSNLVKSRSRNISKGALSSIVSFVAKRIGQGYLGTLKWKDNDKFEVLSVPLYVSNAFPNTFITDARTLSFEEHSKLLEHALLEKGVSVTSLYHDYDLVHEYQFNLGTIYDDGKNYAQINFDALIHFLNQ